MDKVSCHHDLIFRLCFSGSSYCSPLEQRSAAGPAPALTSARA